VYTFYYHKSDSEPEAIMRKLRYVIYMTVMVILPCFCMIKMPLGLHVARKRRLLHGRAALSLADLPRHKGLVVAAGGCLWTLLHDSMIGLVLPSKYSAACIGKSTAGLIMNQYPTQGGHPCAVGMIHDDRLFAFFKAADEMLLCWEIMSSTICVMYVFACRCEID
jgi:hypothetical protein